MYIPCRSLHVLHLYMLVRLMFLQRVLVQAMEYQGQWRRLPVMAMMRFRFHPKDHSDEEQAIPSARARTSRYGGSHRGQERCNLDYRSDLVQAINTTTETRSG